MAVGPFFTPRNAQTALLGLSTVRGLFSPAALTRMGELNERPIVFALSNPTSRSECTCADAAAATDGRAIFGSGSPFADAASPLSGRVVRANQGNNFYSAHGCPARSSSHSLGPLQFFRASGWAASCPARRW